MENDPTTAMRVASKLPEQKLNQAQALLQEHSLPAWVIIQHAPIFTLPSIGRDPAIQLLAAPPAYELAVYVVAPDEAHVFHDYPLTGPGSGRWLTSLVQDPLRELRDWLSRRGIGRLAVDIDRGDPRNDGLSASLAEALRESTGCVLVSAKPLLRALWQLKMPAEIDALCHAQSETARALEELAGAMRPGWTHGDIARWLRVWGAERGYQQGWTSDFVPPPIVGFGAPSQGHLCLIEGQSAYVDFAYEIQGFCSDLQRTYYAASSDQPRPPSEVEEMFDFGMKVLDQLRRECRAGAVGHELYSRAQERIQVAGYTMPFPHLGHPIGRSVNVPGALLEPPDMNVDRTSARLRAGEVYALGARLLSDRHAYVVGVEEVIHIGERESTYLSPPQEAIWVVRQR